MRWRLPSRPRCSLAVLVAAAGHDGRRPGQKPPYHGAVQFRRKRTYVPAPLSMNRGVKLS
jgi:hypothetical protein